MKITLNKNSWHFRFYHYTTGSSTPPMSLCPYFWSLVGLAVLFPILLIAKGIISLLKVRDRFRNKFIAQKKEKEKMLTGEALEKHYEKMVRKLELTDTIGKAFAFISILSIVFLIITLFAIGISELGWFKMMVQTFIAFGIVISAFGVVWLLQQIVIGSVYLSQMISNLSGIQMIKGMIISAYTKACPIIDWNEEIKNKKYEY
jgi:hypothetical protein